ncbi:unnamed protein product [Dovyalis caffra]|uniref:Uncharacterized protein n=1 Tax=Dovyalis caffra TaxID=77055 RepID=A0AAV1R342_9ROSI|nr:unnamed protein product [Dovyalis caffra]
MGVLSCGHEKGHVSGLLLTSRSRKEGVVGPYERRPAWCDRGVRLGDGSTTREWLLYKSWLARNRKEARDVGVVVKVIGKRKALHGA